MKTSSGENIHSWNNALEEYITTYRGANLPLLRIGNPLDLFPSETGAFKNEILLPWEKDWPCGDSAGIYLAFDAQTNLIYIGKASVLRNRLTTYFGNGKNCILREQWGTRPKYIITVAVPDSMPFEAAGLEAFMIWKLKPSLNTHGK